MKKYKVAIFSTVVHHIGLLSERVKLLSPSTLHLVTEPFWVKAQCKNKLLVDADRISLSHAAGERHKALFSANQAFAGLEGPTPKLATMFDGVQAADGIFEAARGAIVLIAHLHVC